jgi:hypothetical protein
VPHCVNRFEATGRNEPGAWIRRNTISWPLPHRRGKRIVQPLFGEIEVAQQTDERAQNLT